MRSTIESRAFRDASGQPLDTSLRKRPLITAAILLAFGHATPALADCNLVPTAGDDNHLCDSGTAPGLNDPGGNNPSPCPLAAAARSTAM